MIHRTSLICICFVVSLFVVGASSWLFAQEAQWIWSPEQLPGRVPAGDCYFRKTITLSNVEQARIDISADDTYELYVNGRLAGRGNSAKALDQYEVSRMLIRGRNVVCVKGTNISGGSAGVAVRLQIKPVGQPWRNFPSDDSWKTSLEATRMWTSVGFDDSEWAAAQVLGKLGQKAPWEDARNSSLPPIVDARTSKGNALSEPTVTNPIDSHDRQFTAPQGFIVQRILSDSETGSLIALAFNEFGHLVVSREGAGLFLVYDSNRDGIPDKIREYGDSVKNIQGILPLNGDVFVTGDGPEGSGLYRLIDADRNGSLEKTQLIVRFKGSPGEHGAHQLTLGPDGFVYMILGNHVTMDSEPSSSSTYQFYYEGDVVQPRLEDPGGHAAGVRAPGGTVVRVDINSGAVQTIAGGIRNAYDLAFHPNGSLFIHDSDMESDVGAVWYQPTRVLEVQEGSEFGWRSGWANWPSYYLDRLPPLVETGRGSPTGIAVYDHYAFPKEYHRSLFLADWSEGRVLCLQLNPDGAGFRGQADVFLRGQPLNITDLEVGPDGALYFCTGGRGTTGGIYRVAWTGTSNYQPSDLGQGITKAIRFPQISSAWGRQQVALTKKELGSNWEELVLGVAYSNDNPARYRTRALDLMQLLGPVPPTTLLVELSKSSNEAIRQKTARLLGLKSSDEDAIARLVELLSDPNRLVQRTACESLTRLKVVIDPNQLIPLLTSDDRRLAFAGRQLLQQIATDSWKSSFVQSSNQRLRIQSSLALIAVEPQIENAELIVDNILAAMEGFVSDQDFIDMLRVLQVTLHLVPSASERFDSLAERVLAEFPAGEPVLNRELIRLAIAMQLEEIIPSALTYVASEEPLADRLNIGIHLTFLHHAWTPSERIDLLKLFEEALLTESGSSYPLYILNVTREFAANMTLEEARTFIANGKKWPNAAFVALTCLPEKLSDSDRELVKKIDREIDQSGLEPNSFKRLKTAATAVLARSGDPESMAYLREVWRRSPDRRSTVAMGLALQPGGENWDYLVRSIPILEPFSVGEILSALTSVPDATDEPETIRQVIVQALSLDADGESPKPALSLLQHWIGFQPSETASSDQEKVAAWQTWFSKTFPNHPEAKLPELNEKSRWSLATINEYLDSPKGRFGDPDAGLAAYNKGRCASCHVLNAKGIALGPDLTAVAKRFTRQEVLESIIFPSHVISDQYASQKVLTTGGEVHVGLVTNHSDGGVTIRKSDLTEVRISSEEIEEIAPSKLSFMPAGLLDGLSLVEIRDMLCTLGFVPTDPNIREAKLPVPISSQGSSPR